MAVNAKDPLTALLVATWNMLESNTGFTALVRSSNRIKFDRDDPIKDTVSTIDKPEVVLVPIGFGPDQGPSQSNIASSSTALLVFNLQLQIATGQQHLIDQLLEGKSNVFRVLWEAYRTALGTNWQTHYANLSWGSPAKSFSVHRLRVRSGSFGIRDVDLDRGIMGWSSLVEFEIGVALAFATHVPA